MIDHHVHSVTKTRRNHRVKSPTQTGFSSPATHYSEPRIDLNEILIKNANATFYIRVADNSFSDFGILKNDVLIVDKSIPTKANQLAFIINDGEFSIANITETNTLEIWGIITYVIKSVL